MNQIRLHHLAEEPQAAQAKVYQIRLLEPFPVDPNLPVNSGSTRTCLDLIRFRADGIPPTLSLFELIEA